MRLFMQFLPDGQLFHLLESSKVPGVGPAIPADFVEVTALPIPAAVKVPGDAYRSWERMLQGFYNRGTKKFTLPAPETPSPAELRKQELKDQPTPWSDAERDEYLRLL